MAITRLNTNAFGTSVNLASNVTGTLPTANGGTGATSFEAGSLVKLQSQTASSASTVTFSSTYITNTYNIYQIHLTDIVISADGHNIGFVVSPNNGDSYVTSGYRNVRQYSNDQNSSNTISSGHGSGDDQVRVLGTGHGLGANGNESGNTIITLFSPLGSKSKQFRCDGSLISNEGYLATQNLWFCLDQSATYNNIKFQRSSGTFSGVFTLYGVTK